MDESNNSRPAVAVGDEPECNQSTNSWLSDIVARRYGRREIVQGGIAATLDSMIAVPHSRTPPSATLSPTASIRTGRRASIRPSPPYIPGDFNTGEDRERQIGAHHDGMHFFALERGERGNQSGVLCINHENIDQPFLHPNGFRVARTAAVRSKTKCARKSHLTASRSWSSRSVMANGAS